MQKKLIALAVASAFAAPAAFAATSNVDVYGIMNVSVDYTTGRTGVSHTTSTPGSSGSAWRVNSNASRVGLKGSEDLGGGLAAIWQIETTINVDNGTGQAAGGLWGGMRDTFVGLSGSSWGTVIAGTHDTPYKMSTASQDPFADTMGDYNAAIGSFEGFNVADLRLGNVLAYVSPNFSGVSFAGAYSFMKETGQNGGSGGSPGAYSLMVNYARGPLYLAGAYEKANHITPNLGYTLPSYVDADLESWKLGAGFTMGDFTVNALYEHIKGTFNVAGIYSTSESRHTWGLNGVYNIGNIALKAGFYDIGALSDSSSTGAKMYEVGADYNLSKRTKVYAVYERMDNDTYGNYCVGGSLSAGFGTSGVTPVCPNNTSQALDGFSLGLKHTF
jgi:predicted porin